MIVKMKFLSITGPKEDIDRIVDQYISKYDFHLENALSELKNVHGLRPFTEANPYKDLYAKASSLVALLKPDERKATGDMNINDAMKTIESLDKELSDLNTHSDDLKKQLSNLKDQIACIAPFRGLNYNIEDIRKCSLIKYRFGHIPVEYYDKLESYLNEYIDSIFFKSSVSDGLVWGVYFVPASEADKVDAIYSSIHFDRIYVPDNVTGTPETIYKKWNKDAEDLLAKIDDVGAKTVETIANRKNDLLLAHKTLERFTNNFDVRKLAACTRDDHKVFFILCGWMPESDAKKLEKDIEDDYNAHFIIEDDHDNIFSKPPTKLKNPKIFKPFEMFIQMYGLPGYNELDPTIFIALSYAFIFGWMFGDVGQGLCLVALGLLLYKIKKLNLGAVLASAGVFSTFFGFMFGSFFGFEDVIEPIWLRPIESMTKLPLVGNLNTVFIVAVAFGMALIILTMIFHIINAIKQKDIENTYFDTNGLTGLVFYGSAILSIVLIMMGKKLPAAIVLVVMFCLPLILIALKEPITNAILKKKPEEKTGAVMFIVQAFFELFEVLLSYFSNTLSFVRIGAFAVSHAAMMQVVLMLAGAENGGTPNWIIIVLGNIFVCCMEGLVVGIQVLRLEYYEFFSRFYKGDGRAFEPYKISK